MELKANLDLLQNIEKLKNAKIVHSHYLNAVTHFWTLISAALPGEVVLGVGPSRVGKTKSANEALDLALGKSPQVSAHYRPVVRLSARNSAHSATYDTKIFMTQALNKIEHPIFGRPLDDDPDGIQFAQRIKRTSQDVLTEAFVRAIQSRQVKYILIDEVQHLQYVKGGFDRAAAVLDSWKCLAEELGVVLVLTGAYPIREVLQQSPHMLGRRMIAHFRRYRETETDLEEFKKILNTLGQLVPMVEGHYAEHIKLLLRGSLGCIGHLLRWTREAMAHAMMSGKSKVSVLDFHRTQMPADDLAAVLREIQGGEQWLENLDHDYGPAPEDPQNYKTSIETKRGSSTSRRRKAKPFKKKARNATAGGRA